MKEIEDIKKEESGTVEEKQKYSAFPKEWESVSEFLRRVNKERHEQCEHNHSDLSYYRSYDFCPYCWKHLSKFLFDPEKPNPLHTSLSKLTQ